MNDVMKTSGSRLRTVGIWSGYGLFFFAALLVSLLLTFPNRQLKSYVEAQARAAGYPLRIGEMSLRGLGSVHLSDVDLTLPAKTRKAARAGDPKPRSAAPMQLHFDALRLDFALLPALSGKLDLKFEMEVGDGVLEGGRARVAGKQIDVEIKTIDHLSLEKMGVGARALAFQDQLSGELDGLLSGNLRVHWGGTHEDFTGQINLEIEDAVLRSPRLEVQGGLVMRDLMMGVLTAKVTIDQLGKIAILKGQSARNKATAISLEGVDIFGPDLELVLEERSHIAIPPGKQGLRMARMQVHFAFALPQPQPKAEVREGETRETEEGISDRLKWSDIMKFAGDKLKPFQRAGYIGMTCTGPISRPKCIPALPQVTVGTRRKARSDARARKKDGDDGKAAAAKKADEADKKADEAAKIAEEAASKAIADKKIEADKEAAKEEAAAAKKAEEDKKKAEAAKVELKTVQDRQLERPGVPEPDDDPRRGAPAPDEEAEEDDMGDDPSRRQRIRKDAPDEEGDRRGDDEPNADEDEEERRARPSPPAPSDEGEDEEGEGADHGAEKRLPEADDDDGPPRPPGSVRR